MKIKIKKLHPDAKMPKRGTKYAAGFDLYAAESSDGLSAISRSPTSSASQSDSSTTRTQPASQTR